MCTVLDGDGNVIVTNYSVLDAELERQAHPPVRGHDAGNSTGHLVNWNYANTGLLCNDGGHVTDTWNDKVGRTATRS